MNINKNKPTPYDALKNRLARLLKVTATLGAWTLLFLAIIWALGAIGWYLLARLWLKELFVPSAVYQTVTVVLIAILWAVLLWCSALLWSRYHYHRYYQRNHRQLLLPAIKTQKLLWQENILDTSSFSVSTSLPMAKLYSKIISDSASYKETAVASENKENHKRYSNEMFFIDTTLKEDLHDENGKIILSAGEIISPKKLEQVIACGLYGEFITKLSRQSFFEEENK